MQFSQMDQHILLEVISFPLKALLAYIDAGKVKPFQVVFRKRTGRALVHASSLAIWLIQMLNTSKMIMRHERVAE
jgi:hypothetical protein